MATIAVPYLLQSSIATPVPLPFPSRSRLQPRRQQKPLLRVRCGAKADDSEDIGRAGYAAIAAGLVANPVVLLSLYTLKTTGCGLPPGPGGSIGALEGLSFLVIAGLVGWSILTKVTTGSGLRSGPLRLLGVVEGLSYLTLLAIAVVFGLQYLDRGYIPGPLPGEKCL